MRTLKHPNLFTGAIVLGLVVVGVESGTSIRHGQIRELYSGVWASHNLNALPLPVSGYQAYIVGEMHGVKENEEILLQYLTLLHE